ncbi:MAG: aryl-sulfate sulfotransferase, partial [Myxococcales bacterium]|nr:aryl-sulfate sulfotransferase [Myxococcales bacterium]
MTWLGGSRAALVPTVLLLSTAVVGCSRDAAQGPALVGDPQLIFHPNQPMVVDVVVEFDGPIDAAELELVHDADPGVVVATIADGEAGDGSTHHHFRVRGLGPGSDHALSLDWAGRHEAVAFTTQAPLPGFIPGFEVVGLEGAAEVLYRIFDYSYGPAWSPNGLFVVDPQGTTRWYIGGEPLIPGPLAVYAGVTLLDDGTMLTTRDGAVQVIDELGEVVRRHDAAALAMSAFHHEAMMLQSGNILTFGNSFEMVDYADQGWGELLVAGDLLVEFDPAGEIAWTWDAFDHLDPQR